MWRCMSGRAIVGLCFLIAVALGNRAFTRTQAADSPYRVRIAYVVPSDRQPQANYREKAAVLVGRIRDFYADQMECNGFGRMTFNVESAADGRPEVHLIHSPMTAAVFADTGHARYVTGKYWEHAFQSVIDAGFRPDDQGEIWLCFVEAQEQVADGSVKNDSTQGNGRFGSGFALCTGLELALGGDPDLIHDHRNYANLTIPAIGPHPLQWHKSFPDYQGDDVSSLAADYISATAHELGHCFLLQHTYINDATKCGNLMGNGFRGWRGYYMPSRFPDEDTRLSRPSALMLRLCPFFRRPAELAVYSDPPKITIQTTPGAMGLTHGVFHLSFTASEPKGPGIAMATLENGRDRDGVGVVTWLEFDGKARTVSGDFETTSMSADQEDTWRVTVLDASGNESIQTIKMTSPRTGIGPSPFISVGHTRVRTGVAVKFKGSVKRPWKYTYLWDFGDGTKGSGALVDHIFAKPGVYHVHLSAIDAGGRIGQIAITMCAKDTDPPDR